MAQVDVNNAPAVNGSGVNTEPALNKKSDRKEYFRRYMKDYRAKQAANKDEIKPSPEITNSEIKPEPEIKLETPEPKPEAPIVDPAAERIRQQIQADHEAQEFNRLNQQIHQVFNFWRGAGLSEAQLRLLAADPIAMVRLTDATSQHAAQAGPIGSAPYLEEGKRWFIAQVDHAQQQIEEANRAAASPQMDTPMPIDNQSMPPLPEPLRARATPTRSGLYAAPVSRETVGTRDPGPRSGGTLSAAEAEAARISGITPAEYLKQKWKLQELRAAGLYDSEPQRR